MLGAWPATEGRVTVGKIWAPVFNVPGCGPNCASCVAIGINVCAPEIANCAKFVPSGILFQIVLYESARRPRSLLSGLVATKSSKAFKYVSLLLTPALPKMLNVWPTNPFSSCVKPCLALLACVWAVLKSATFFITSRPVNGAIFGIAALTLLMSMLPSVWKFSGLEKKSCSPTRSVSVCFSFFSAIPPRPTLIMSASDIVCGGLSWVATGVMFKSMIFSLSQKRVHHARVANVVQGA